MGRYRETLFMCKYKTAKDTFGDLSAVNLARLMFIATFLGDDGYLIKSTYNSTTKKSGFRSITNSCEKPTPLGVGWIALYLKNNSK